MAGNSREKNKNRGFGVGREGSLKQKKKLKGVRVKFQEKLFSGRKIDFIAPTSHLLCA